MSRVIGIDGCKAGWIIAKTLEDKSISFQIIKNLNDDYLKESNVSLIGIDIPLRLSSSGKRLAEIEARVLLKNRACTIFSPPTLNALTAKNYIDACKINFKECGKKISKQSWNLFPKIKEAQEFLENKSIIELGVFEVHPELSFMAMNDMNLIRASKKTVIGREIRIKLIQKFFPKFSFESVRNKYKKNQVLDDDILDSVSVLWSTQRIVDNIAKFVPKDSKKTDMRIYF
jgi:predicted RNase H-like nuclease